MAEIENTATPGQQAPYFAVSPVKFAAMSICTFGIYEFFWFYKNWVHIKQREQTGIQPFWRAFFAVFFCYQCFSRVRADTELLRQASFPAGPLAIGWIVVTLVAAVPGPYFLLSLVSFLFVLPVQAAANRVNAALAPGYDPNARFSAWNWTAIVAGSIAIVLAVVGVFVPDE